MLLIGIAYLNPKHANPKPSAWTQAPRARRPCSRGVNPTNVAGDRLELAGVRSGHDLGAWRSRAAIAWLGGVH